MSDFAAQVNTQFVGKDGFVWWIGQVAPEETWKENIPGKPEDSNQDITGFAERYRVRIMGYHLGKEEVPDEQLPWAYVVYPVTAGTSGGSGSYQSSNISQGDFVFGFFIDGEQAQTPVIWGLLGHNEYQAVAYNLPDEVFRPYTGTIPGVKYASYNVKQIPGGGEVLTQDGSRGFTINDQIIVGVTGDNAIKSVEGEVEKDKGREKDSIAKPSDCEPNPIGRIQTELNKGLKEIQRIKASEFDSRFALVLGTISNAAAAIENICDNLAEFIAGILKDLLDKILKFLINEIGRTMKPTYDLALPNERPAIRQQVENLLDTIVCLIRELIDQLLDLAKEFVCEAADKAINTPACLIENFVGNILSNLANNIDNAINNSLSAIAGLINGLSGMLSGLGIGGGIGILGEILSFLKCDTNIDCSVIDEWSILDGAGQGLSFNFDSVNNNAKGRSSSGSNIDLTNVNIPDTFTDLTCYLGPEPCKPPTLKFIGSGSGAAGNLVISASGEIMSVDMIEGGSLYNANTFAVVVDNCGNGGGAVLDPIIEDGEIVDVIVRDPGAGYLPGEDGSKGGGGSKYSDPEDTIIRREDGTYEPAIPPGNVVELNPGDTVELPPGTVVEDIVGGSPVVVDSAVTITTPAPDYSSTRGDYPNAEDGSYPAILYLCEIRVLESGINYASIDEIVIEPSNGAEASLEVGDQGIVRSVKVTKGGEGFTEVPRVYVKTETGINAVLVPKLCIDRIGEDEAKSPDLQDKIVSVIDCVGKF